MSSQTLGECNGRTESTIGRMIAAVASKCFSCFWMVVNFLPLRSDLRNWSYFCYRNIKWIWDFFVILWKWCGFTSESALHWFDGWTLVVRGKMQRRHACDTLAAYCESMANAPCIRPLNMTSLEMCRIEPMCPGTDRTVCPPIWDDCLPFHDRWRSASVVPSIGTKWLPNRCWPEHLSIVALIFSYFAPDWSSQPVENW